MSTIQTYTRRTGTSFLEFEDRFPNSQSCLTHILHCRFRGKFVCPKCRNSTIFVKNPSGNGYTSSCCKSALIYPLQGTVFSRTNIPLNYWFRATLYFTNSASGISANFVYKQFGLSRKASIRMCKVIREHLTSIDENIRLGLDGATVYVAETTMKAISRRKQKSGVRFRILLATDGKDFLLLPIPTGKYVRSRDLLFNRLEPNAPIVVQTNELKRKLLNFKDFARVKGRTIQTGDDPYHSNFSFLDTCGIAFKQFILQSHYWVSEQHLGSYLGHFAFLYRRRHRGTEAFWEAVSHFPEFAQDG